MDISWLPPLISVAGALGGVALGDYLRSRGEVRRLRADDARRFHDERYKAYSEYLRHLDSHKSLRHRLDADPELVERTEVERMNWALAATNTWLQEMYSQAAQLSLLANQQVREAVDRTVEAAPIFVGRQVFAPTGSHETEANELRDAKAECVNAMRAHLGQDPLLPTARL